MDLYRMWKEKVIMLYLQVYINEKHLATVYIHNRGKKTLKGKYEYEIAEKNFEGKWPVEIEFKDKVYHRREDGWKKLAIKALKKLDNV